MSPESFISLLSLGLGFAVAGLLASGYQAALAHPARFALLLQNKRMRAALSVPFLVFAAPFLIMRNVLADTTRHPRRAAFVMMATVLAGFWSLMSGTALVMLLQATGALA